MNTTQDRFSAVEHHFTWGWAVYDEDLAEGCEGLFLTQAEADAHVREQFEDDQHEDVSVFPMLFITATMDHEHPGQRLTEQEIEALGPCPRLVARAARIEASKTP